MKHVTDNYTKALNYGITDFVLDYEMQEDIENRSLCLDVCHLWTSSSKDASRAKHTVSDDKHKLDLSDDT